MVEVPDDYAVTIKEMRWKLGLTQRELAAKLGVAYVTVNRWENSHTKPLPLYWSRILNMKTLPSPWAISLVYLNKQVISKTLTVQDDTGKVTILEQIRGCKGDPLDNFSYTDNLYCHFESTARSIFAMIEVKGQV
jgi:DNA-binding XRE family transcriptional regulator